MSIPANVVLGGDLDTIGRLRSGRFDDPFMPSMDRPYGEGLLLIIPPYTKFGSVTYTAPLDMELHRVHFDTNKYTTKDDWSLHLNEDVDKNYIVRKNSQKDYTEGLQLMSVVKLKKGDTLTFKLMNTSFGTGIRAEISMAFLIEGENMKGNSTASPSNINMNAVGVHVSYNLFGDVIGNKLSGVDLYDEAVPFITKEGRGYFKLLQTTGVHTGLIPDGKQIKGICQNTNKTVELTYIRDDGREETLTLRKNYVYVGVPDDIYNGAQSRANFLINIEDKLIPYIGFRGIFFRVRGVKQSFLEKTVNIRVR